MYKSPLVPSWGSNIISSDRFMSVPGLTYFWSRYESVNKKKWIDKRSLNFDEIISLDCILTHGRVSRDVPQRWMRFWPWQQPFRVGQRVAMTRWWPVRHHKRLTVPLNVKIGTNETWCVQLKVVCDAIGGSNRRLHLSLRSVRKNRDNTPGNKYRG